MSLSFLTQNINKLAQLLSELGELVAGLGVPDGSTFSSLIVITTVAIDCDNIAAVAGGSSLCPLIAFDDAFAEVCGCDAAAIDLEDTSVASDVVTVATGGFGGLIVVSSGLLDPSSDIDAVDADFVVSVLDTATSVNPKTSEKKNN